MYNFYVYCVNYIPVHVFAAAANFFILVWRKCDCCMVLLSQPMYIGSRSMLSCPALPAEVITTSSLNNSLHLKCIYPLHTRAYQLRAMCSFSQFYQHACCHLTTSSLNNALWTCAYIYIVHTSMIPELFMGLLHIFCIISCTLEASRISTGVPLPYFFSVIN